jgi:hypothetical protein
MPTFRQMVENPQTVTAEAWPFSYLSVNDYIRWRSPDLMVLDGGSIWHLFDITPENGRLHMIVRPEKEVRIRIHSPKYAFFGVRGESSTLQYAKDAFDLEVDSPLFTNPLGANASSMDVTLRGGSMLAVATGSRGDRGKWGTVNDPFHLATVGRDVTQPEDLTRDNSILLNLTAPYNDYSDKGTYSIIYNQHLEDVWVQILDIRDASDSFWDLTDRETTGQGDVDDNSPIGQTLVDGDEFLERITYATGEDLNGRTYIIELGLMPAYQTSVNRDSWVVLVDGAIVTSFFDDKADALQAASLKKNALTKRQNQGGPEEPDLKFVGMSLIIGVILLVAIYGFAKGKGGA